MKYTLILLLMLLPSCRPCEPVTIDLGDLPEEALLFVPYQNGQTVSLKHSAGQVIHYAVSRQTKEERFSWTESCVEYVFEVNSTILTADYPIFNFRFDISNEDTLNYICTAYIGYNSFVIPTFENGYDYFEKADSIVLDTTTYYDVFKLTSYDSNYDNSDSIRPDTLYYNYETGILKITMTNEEYYQITP